MDPDERPHSRDIVIYETLPNELPRVAGIISSVPQTPLSHVNLRALQDGIPNAYIADALDDDEISGLIDGYVHYAVTETGYTIRAATQAEVDAHYAASRPAEAQTPERDLTVTTITPLSDFGLDDWDSFGVKAANVAVLGTLEFPDGTVPDGFAVPFYFYDEFMKHNGLYDDIEKMLADADFQTDFDTQVDELKKLRKKIKKAETPEWIETALTAMHATFPEGTSLRYRSSTNNEDLLGFNGAGLYDSKTQHPEETEEDGISKSLKQVYASLWNFRAFIERDFHRIDHMSTAMGVLVHPNYSDELVNGVAVSADPAYGTDDTHYVNSQVGEDLVTNPESNSVPEEGLLSPGGTYTVVALSNQAPRGQLLLTGDQMSQLRRHLDAIHERFEELYGVEDGEQFAMEIEFKITSDNVLAIKQARPWIFTAPAPSTESDGTGDTGSALTASVAEAPTRHGGESFRVKFLFSELITLYVREFAENAVTVKGGRVTGDRWSRSRVGDYWEVDVVPDSSLGHVTLELVTNRPCGALGAICTYNGQRLLTGLEYTVYGLLPRTPDRPVGRVRSSGAVDLEWDKAPRTESYEVQFRSDGQWTQLPAEGVGVSFDGPRASVSGLSGCDICYFRVRGLNAHGASEWSDSLVMLVGFVWEGELTPGRDIGTSPMISGYSRYGSHRGILSPLSFEMSDTAYTVTFLLHAGESLWLGLDRELPMDFDLHVGDSRYLGSRSKDPPVKSTGAVYWWPSAAPRWSADSPAEVKLSIYPERVLGSRVKAPVTGYFSRFSSDHGGMDDFSFRIYFSEGVAMTATRLREHVLSVSGGTISGAVDVGSGTGTSEGRIWKVSVAPEAGETTVIEIEPDLECGLESAVCASDGRRLFNRLKLSVPAWSLPVSGKPWVGETLTVDTSDIVDWDGLSNAVFSYQWEMYDGSDHVAITGATSTQSTVKSEG